jgi:5-methylcytosine-specific restriction endonuclease McrA
MRKNSIRTEWKVKFLDRITGIHFRNKDKVVDKILRRIDSSKYGLVSRSKKYNVECFITIEDLRHMLYDAYGTPCKYCNIILTIKNLTIDHMIPISKQGSSNKDNLQVICKKCNKIKGSLDEEKFNILLDWFKTIPDELRKDISIRLAHGIH